ncbi:MAG: arsenate reductase ArsC [Chloroflexi bacterium]|nr:arsenate reductase ArsC [Chloroflexota bacterium]
MSKWWPRSRARRRRSWWKSSASNDRSSICKNDFAYQTTKATVFRGGTTLGKRVLFVCIHNAGRSQMAEAFFNQAAEERALDVGAESAGTEPAERVHPQVVEAMREIGLDLAGKQPKILTNEQIERADRVITMGCSVDAGTCPAIFLRQVEDWALADPKGRPMAEVRQIRDEVRRRVDALIAGLC